MNDGVDGLYDSVDRKHRKFLSILDKIVRDIPYSDIPRMVAAIVYKNEIISIGTNSKKSHPFQAKFGRNDKSIFLHAEVSAISAALKRITVEQLKHSTMYIMRIKYDSPDIKNRNLIWGLSQPCPGCRRCINAFNIRKIIFTEEGNSYSVIS